MTCFWADDLPPWQKPFSADDFASKSPKVSPVADKSSTSHDVSIFNESSF